MTLDNRPNQVTTITARGESVSSSIDRMVKEHTHLAQINPNAWWESQVAYMQRSEDELKGLKKEYEDMVNDVKEPTDAGTHVRLNTKLRQLLLETQNFYTVVVSVDRVIKENPGLFPNKNVQQTEDIAIEGEDSEGLTFSGEGPITQPLESAAQDLKREIDRYERLLQ